MLLLTLSLLLGLWILIGVFIHLLVGRNPKQGSKPILRSVDRRICLVGHTIEVSLDCSAAGLPRPAIDAKVTPWDLILVIDHSSSMGTGTGSALHEARKAAINLVRTTPDSFRFSVVEFDHEAREVCPLTDRKRGLVRSIKGITGGGATDIAIGLEVAGKSLERPDGADQGRRRAVLLLSDGASDSDPAVATADALKDDPDLLLITVGIGAADMPLLRRIASTSDHCFHTDQIEELSALYSEIGRMITGQEATEVKVSERFSGTGHWGLRGWGELQPSAFSFKDGEFSWLLAALQETPTTLHYSVEALCPGWHRVAPEPALLHARIADDSLHDVQSNAGPRVLVLPQLLLWQLLWLILNPLFFLLFGRWFRCQDVHVVRPPARIPQPQALELPPLLEATRAAQPKLSIRPTLIIGLGYAGIHSLTQTKRLAWERGLRVNPHQLHFLGIDTADELFFPSPPAGPITLESNERITLDRPLEPIIAAEAIAISPEYDWLVAASLSAGGARPDLHRGTGHQRTLGRLAVIENRAALEARIGPLLDDLIARASDLGIDILVTASSGGGTGSGGLLELCWTVRNLLVQRGYGDSSTTLFLTAPAADPGQNVSPQEQGLRQANHLALLAELDRIATQRGEAMAPAPQLMPVKRWLDRVFFIGPVGHTSWRAKEVLYPKTAEAIFTWLASDETEGLRDHFIAQDAIDNDFTRRLGRCLVHRADPVSHYLYPASLHTYLVGDILRRTLASRLWGLDGRESVEYSADAQTPKGVSALLQSWIEVRQEAGDLPWVFNALGALEDPTHLQSSLNRGAGPEISTGISPLARNELFDEQRSLIRGALDSWLQDTLNRGREGICEPHALALCIHTLRELHRRLREGTENAAHLITHSRSPVVRREAETVAELATHAATETETLIRRLGDWDRRLGEGTEGAGLMRRLDEGTGRLHIEIEALRDADNGNEAPRSPRLPLSWEQIDALPERFFPELGERISDRLGWRIERSGSQLHIGLHLQGTGESSWTPDDLGLTDVPIQQITDTLLEIGTELSPDFAEWILADQDPQTLPGLHIERPRSDGLNPGARALYLVQSEGQLQTPPHVDRVDLRPFDRCESRVIGCEEHLASDRLWPARATDLILPHVFTEERNAYRGYAAYCRAESREPEPLAPTLVGLCCDPDALIAFALTGLADLAIQSRDDGLRRIWSVQGIAGLDQPIDLAQHDEDPLTAFQRAARGWIATSAPALRRFTAPTQLDPQALSERIARHELAAAIADQPWYEQLIAVVWGLLRWY